MYEIKIKELEKGEIGHWGRTKGEVEGGRMGGENLSKQNRVLNKTEERKEKCTMKRKR